MLRIFALTLLIASLLQSVFAACPDFVITSINTFNRPWSVAVGDMNGDGKIDLAVANRDSNTVSRLLGNGDGTFAADFSPVGAGGPVAVAVGDFNGDGKSDMAVGDSIGQTIGGVTYTDSLRIFLSGISGSTGYGLDGGPFFGIALGEFNGDGKIDLAVGFYSSGQVWTFVGKGNGFFQIYSVNEVNIDYPVSIAVGDFNGDGKSDLAVANSGFASPFVSVLLGRGDATFFAAVNYLINAAGADASSVVVGDFNSDGKADLAVADRYNDNVAILIGNGDGTFAAAVSYPVGNDPSSVAVGDFNGDGKSDLAVSNWLSDNISILIGAGNGTFGAPVNYPVDFGPNSVAVADFNGDGKKDLAVANSRSFKVSIMLNRCVLAFDPNGDGQVTVGDVFYLVNFLFAGGEAPRAGGDANFDAQSTVADIFYLINHLFTGGPAPG